MFIVTFAPHLDVPRSPPWQTFQPATHGSAHKPADGAAHNRAVKPAHEAAVS